MEGGNSFAKEGEEVVVERHDGSTIHCHSCDVKRYDTPGDSGVHVSSDPATASTEHQAGHRHHLLQPDHKGTGHHNYISRTSTIQLEFYVLVTCFAIGLKWGRGVVWGRV